ncbi:MAG: hypothetical protein RSG52_04920 [Terrisporobacter sp.]|uniref:hypothetical protein n=1 Tax=Terrisporobacter sp. TaxID=1965305 RepID=UPI002FC9B087
MESIKLLKEIKKIPKPKKYDDKEFCEMLNLLDSRKTTDCFIEAAFATEIGLREIFESRNVPDNIFNAYKDSFANSEISLFEHYEQMLERGDKAALGFINNLKGKVFECELEGKLENLYEGFDFNLADSPIQPIWDLKGINEFGEEIFVQAKLWGEGNASKLIELMNENPDILYAASNEIREKVLQNAPELANQFVDIDVNNYEFTEGVKENLELLIENMGINVPDDLGDILPYISEIVLGIRLIIDLIHVQRDLKNISAEDKAKLSALKVIILMSRYGVTLACTTICSAAGGSLGGGVGGIAGGVGGAILAGKINKEIKPYMLDISLELVGLEKEDMFYFDNKKRIDNLAVSYINTKIL